MPGLSVCARDRDPSYLYHSRWSVSAVFRLAGALVGSWCAFRAEFTSHWGRGAAPCCGPWRRCRACIFRVRRTTTRPWRQPASPARRAWFALMYALSPARLHAYTARCSLLAIHLTAVHEYCYYKSHGNSRKYFPRKHASISHRKSRTLPDYHFWIRGAL